MTDSTSNQERYEEDVPEYQGMLRRCAPELADCGKDVLRLAFKHLTPNEQEFVAQRVLIGMKTGDIMEIDGFRSRQHMHSRWQSLMKIIRFYMEYFANCDHERALRQLRKEVPQNHWELLLDCFSGCSSDEFASRHHCPRSEVTILLNALQHAANSRSNRSELAKLLKTISKLCKFRRL